MQETNLALGVRHALVAAAAFSVMGALIKLAATEMSTPVITFLRNLFGLIFLLPLLLREPLSRLRTDRPWLHLQRTVVGLTAMYAFFYAIAQIPLAEAMLLNYAAPLYVPLIAWAWLKEKPHWGLWPLILVGLVGVGLIVRPDPAAEFRWVSLVAVISGVFAAWAFVTIRKLSATEPAPRIVFWFGVYSVIITAIPALLAWKDPSLRGWLLLLGVGLFATIAQISLTRSYALIPAAQVAPLNYMTVVFSLLIGWLFWAENLSWSSLFGTVLVIGSSIAALRLR
ncbi:MAG: DMT family transporter [Oceanococcaceae bacterium]